MRLFSTQISVAKAMKVIVARKGIEVPFADQPSLAPNLAQLKEEIGIHGHTEFYLLDGTRAITGDINHDGTNIGFYSTTPTPQSSAYTPSNESADRAFDANAAAGSITSPPTQAEVENIRDAVLELSDVVATMINDLQLTGILG